MYRRGVDTGDLLRDEGGVAMVMALGFLMLLTMGFATSIALTASNARQAFRSGADQKAFALAEAGINDAVAVVFAPANVAAARTVSCANPASYAAYANLLPPRTTQRDRGSTTWSGSFVCNGATPYWQLTSIGRVPNPTGPNGGLVTRTATAKIPLGSSPQTVTEPVWELREQVRTTTVVNVETHERDEVGWSGGSFFYTWGNLDACSGTGTMVIATSVIADGSFCLAGGSAQVQATATAVNVGGVVELRNGALMGMGPATPPRLVRAMGAVDAVAVVSSTSGFPNEGMVVIDDEFMQYRGTAANASGCGTTLQAGQGCFQNLRRGFLPDRPASSHELGAIVDGRIETVDARGGCGTCVGVNAITLRTGTGAQLPNIPRPTVLVEELRADAAPGPAALPSPACSIGGVADPFATSADPYYVARTLDLTPSSSYTCRATSARYGAGELSWDNAAKVLTARGVVYIPSNAVVTQSLRYTTFADGEPRATATVFVAGTFTYSQHNVCARQVGTTTACDTLTWDPKLHSELAIVSANLPAGGSRAAQTGTNATGPAHTVTGLQNAQFQGFIHTDGEFSRGGGNGFVSGTVFAGRITLQGGTASAPAPGTSRLPRGVFRDPWTETTTTILTQTDVLYAETHTTSVATVHTPTTPYEFGG